MAVMADAKPVIGFAALGVEHVTAICMLQMSGLLVGMRLAPHRSFRLQERQQLKNLSLLLVFRESKPPT